MPPFIVTAAFFIGISTTTCTVQVAQDHTLYSQPRVDESRLALLPALLVIQIEYSLS